MIRVVCLSNVEGLFYKSIANRLRGNDKKSNFPSFCISSQIFATDDCIFLLCIIVSKSKYNAITVKTILN